MFRPVGLLRLGQWSRVLRREGCREAILVGRVAKTRMYDRLRYFRYIPDLTALRIWFGELRHDKRPYSVLTAIARQLDRDGIRLIDSTTFCRDHMASNGVMTNRQPTAAQWQDIHHGWEICQALSRLDVGQAIAVFNRDVIAAEAIEGTAAMIERAGALCRVGGWTLVKVSNTRRDPRLDVPVIGLETIAQLKAAGAGCVVVESGQVMLLEKSAVLKSANQAGITVIGM